MSASKGWPLEETPVEDTPTGTPIETPIETPTKEMPIDTTSIEENVDECGPLRQLINAWSAQEAHFCCGGVLNIPDRGDIVSRFEKLTYDNGQFTSPPIVLRWDPPNGDAMRKLTLPLAGDTSAIEDLLKGCAPASFGKGGEEVLDESYRKAAKLDTDCFSTNFNPYDGGIIDAITQSLLPGIAKTFADGNSIFEDHLGVVAELYKLNVSQATPLQSEMPVQASVANAPGMQIYSAPSGKFRAHVDTPRGAKQIGSLVICLPFPHEGGQLRVAHQGRETTFDWSQNSANCIQWAAFFSDCEHEVLEVTSGHRITLTYNLYVQERVGGILRQHSMIDPRQYDIHNQVIDAIKSDDFLPNGGTLGFFCRHAYAHTSNSHRTHFPYALKGVDAMFYSIFRRLGLSVKVTPVICDDQLKYDRQGLMKRKKKDLDPDADLVGTQFHEIILRDYHDDMRYVSEQVNDMWHSEWRGDITWFNTPVHEELAMAQAAYGNEPTLDWHYSAAAILVEVPELESKLRTEATKA